MVTESMAFQNASSRNRFFFLQQNALGLKPEGAVALSVQTPGRFREGSGRFRAGSGQVPSRFREGSGRVRELAAQVPGRGGAGTEKGSGRFREGAGRFKQKRHVRCGPAWQETTQSSEILSIPVKDVALRL